MMPLLLILYYMHLSIFQHFLDFITKDYVEDISSIPLEYLQEADVRLVIIGPAPYKFIPVSILDILLTSLCSELQFLWL